MVFKIIFSGIYATTGLRVVPTESVFGSVTIEILLYVAESPQSMLRFHLLNNHLSGLSKINAI
jgi:hypothetical protein